VAVAKAPFGAPCLYSGWGRISLTSSHNAAHARDKSLVPEADADQIISIDLRASFYAPFRVYGSGCRGYLL